MVNFHQTPRKYTQIHKPLEEAEEEVKEEVKVELDEEGNPITQDVFENPRPAVTVAWKDHDGNDVDVVVGSHPDGTPDGTIVIDNVPAKIDGNMIIFPNIQDPTQPFTAIISPDGKIMTWPNYVIIGHIGLTRIV